MLIIITSSLFGSTQSSDAVRAGKTPVVAFQLVPQFQKEIKKNVKRYGSGKRAEKKKNRDGTEAGKLSKERRGERNVSEFPTFGLRLSPVPRFRIYERLLAFSTLR